MTLKESDPGVTNNEPPETPVIRELRSSEFPLANAVWHDYHETTGTPACDRIFGVFLSGALISAARCRRHQDGFEVDGIFTQSPFRNRGYSRLAVGALVEACHNEDLYMYAVKHLEPFYRSFGFGQIPESALPPAIRERYLWATGNLEGAEVVPMCRVAGISWMKT